MYTIFLEPHVMGRFIDGIGALVSRWVFAVCSLHVMFIQSGLRPLVRNNLKLLDPTNKLPQFFIVFAVELQSALVRKEDQNNFHPMLMFLFSNFKYVC